MSSLKRLRPIFYTPVLEEVGNNLKSWLAPLYVEVKAEGDAEIPIVDLEHIRNMNFYANMIGLVRHGNVHA